MKRLLAIWCKLRGHRWSRKLLLHLTHESKQCNRCGEIRKINKRKPKEA